MRPDRPSPAAAFRTPFAFVGFALSLGLGLGIAFAPSAVEAGVVSIQPSLFETAIEPGEDFTAVVGIHYAKEGPGDVEPVRVILGTEDWEMDGQGSLAFRSGEDVSEDSARPWIVFSPGEAEIVPGETLKVRVSVIVPEDAARGEYRAALVAQPRSPFRPLQEGEKRLDLRCRLASILYVQVGPLSESIELSDLRVMRRKDRLHLVPRFHNGGEAHVRVIDEFEILPEGDPVQGILCYRDSQEAGVVLPGHERDLEHPLPCDLPPGRYSVVYRADAGRDHPIMEGETTFEVTLPSELPVPAVVARTAGANAGG